MDKVEYHATYYLTHINEWRVKNWKKRGIVFTVEEYDALLDKQGGGCAICGAKPRGRALHVDHDHKTGRIRGLLCMNCNRKIVGVIESELGRKAIRYIGG